MTTNDPKELSQQRLDAIYARLAGAGHGQAAAEVSRRIQALEKEITRVQQHYEEFVIPLLEGRPMHEMLAQLTAVGHGAAAAELAGNVQALEERRTMMHQYYEEFLIPDMEGRPIQKGSGPRWVQEVVSRQREWER